MPWPPQKLIDWLARRKTKRYLRDAELNGVTPTEAQRAQVHAKWAARGRR